MRTFVFTGRNIKEIVRDPINLFFGLLFPVLMLVIMSLITKNAPIPVFEINNLSPGIAVFGLSFLSLFSGIIVSKDRSSAFLSRLYTTPLRAVEIIVGYLIALLPVALAQCVICYVVSLLFGFEPTWNILLAIIAIIPISIFFIALGLLFGSIMNEKAIGGAIGSTLPVATSLLGGCWLDLNVMGEGMRTFAHCLPFANALELEKCILSSSYEGALVNFAWVFGYMVITLLGAILLFLRQMKKQ